jgi:hypothetical protein
MQMARVDAGRGRAAPIALLGFLGLALLLRAPGFPAAVLDPDEGLYLVQARAWLEGGWPYLAVWDMHPPGAPALLALALALVADPVIALRLAGVVAVAATAGLLHALARRLGAAPGTALAAGLLYVAQSTMPDGLATNTEILFAPFVTLAALLLLAEARREASPRAGVVLAAGFAAGMAVWIKQVAALEASALWLTMIGVAWAKGRMTVPRALGLAVLFALGAGAPTLGLAARYWAVGHGEAWWQANILGPLHYAGLEGNAPGLRRGVLGAVPALAGLALAAALAWRDPAARLLLPWLAASALAVAAPGKFYDHYFLILAPPLSLLAAFGLAALVRHAVVPALRRRGFAVLVALVMAMPVGGMLLPRLAEGIGLRGADPVRAIAGQAAAALRPGEALFVANWHAVTYVLAGAPPPTRLAFPLHLSGHDTRLAGIDTQAELSRVLALPPGVIVVDPGRWGPIRAEARAAIEAALARDYALAATIQDGPGPVQVWRLR